MVYLDTHVVAWLYAGTQELLSKDAVRLIEERDLFISPIVELELQYLKEAGKIKKSPRDIMSTLSKEINLKICPKDFHSVVQEAGSFHWTRDPFDRLIVAQASLQEKILITKDEIIRDHYKKAVW